MPHIHTLLAQAGRGRDPQTGAISTPIYQTATYAHPALGQSTGFDYSRGANPTRQALEDAMAVLDGAAGACAFASGLAALTTLVCLFGQGDHLVVAEGCYGGTYRLLDQVMAPFGLEVTYVPILDLAGYRAALGPRTRGILVESVSNPCLQVPNLPALATLAQAAGALLIVDNTLLTPYWLRPLDLGADLVLHSASKYLAGHNDCIAGIVAARCPELAGRLRFLQNAMGTALAPQEAWLSLRGLKTLALRLEQQRQSALAIARWLQGHPSVRRVYFPGLPEDPGHGTLMGIASGPGALVSFEVGDTATLERLISRVSVIAYAESFGGVESLITVPAVQTHANLSPAERIRLGVTPTLVRLSVGIEDPDDLIADLALALDGHPPG